MKAPKTPSVCRHKDECRIHRPPYSFGTCMAWTPIYNGRGKLMNSDPNSYTSSISCSTCGGAWWQTTKGGKTTVELKTPDVPSESKENG